jgi:hypothetical protein
MKELIRFRQFLNEDLEEGFFDKFKEKEQPKDDYWKEREEINYEVAGEVIKAAKATLSQMTDVFAPALIQKKLQDLDDLYQLTIDGISDGRLTDEGLEQLETTVKNILNQAKFTFEGLDEGLGDQIGAAFQGIGKGVSSVLSVLIGAVVAIGVLIVAGASAALSGVVTLLGFAGAGIIRAVEKLIVVPSINSALKRLSEDEEVMAIAMKPSASGLRKIADEKLTTGERMVVGNWIKKNVTREMLGVNRRWRGGKYVATKSKKGPGLKDGDYTPLI